MIAERILTDLERLQQQLAAKAAELAAYNEQTQQLRDAYDELRKTARVEEPGFWNKGGKQTRKLEALAAEIGQRSATGHELNQQYLNLARQLGDVRSANRLNDFLARGLI